MNIVTLFETLSTSPFCSRKDKEKLIEKIIDIEAKKNFLKGDQLSLRENLSVENCKRFPDVVDVVKF